MRSSARWSSPRWYRPPGAHPTEDDLSRVAGPDLELQDPAPHRVHHPRRRPEDHDRKVRLVRPRPTGRSHLTSNSIESTRWQETSRRPALGGGDRPLREGPGDQDRHDHPRSRRRPQRHDDRRPAPYADLVRQASFDDDVKVLVIRANGPNLGSGADLPELMDIMAGRSDVADEAHRPHPRGRRRPVPARRAPTGTARRTCSSTPTRARGCGACRTSRRSASSRCGATATAGTSTKPPTPTSSSRPRTRSSATPRSATRAGPRASGSGAR